MTIYVDPAIWPYMGKLYCHCMTDGDIEELHDFALRLGLKKTWFQDKPSRKHYDLSANKRKQAIAMGAVAVTSKEMLQKCSERLIAIMQDEVRRECLDSKRITAYVSICPACDERDDGHWDEDCRYCGTPHSKEWETIEVDIVTDIILRTVIPAKKEG